MNATEIEPEWDEIFSRWLNQSMAQQWMKKNLARLQVNLILNLATCSMHVVHFEVELSRKKSMKHRLRQQMTQQLRSILVQWKHEIGPVQR
jgi:hypothetical protein